MERIKKKKMNKGALAVLCFALFIALALLQLFLSFRGLSEPVSMDQAQVAREIARGNGFSTQFLRPLAVNNLPVATWDETNKATIPDTNLAPLYPYVESLVFRLVGAENTEQWRMSESVYVHNLDRVVASISILFYFLSIVAAYVFIKSIFDVRIARFSVILFLVCGLLWTYALSGLPQMMAMFLFLVGLIFVRRGIERKEAGRSLFLPLVLASVFFSLMCLTHWLCIWIMIGFVIYLAFSQTPKGIYALIPVVVFGLLVGGWLVRNQIYTGNLLGMSFYAIYEGIQNEAADVYRSLSSNEVPLESREFMLRMIRGSILQNQNIYMNLGLIFVAPLFFFALFHPFKRKIIGSFKWMFVSMWLCAAVGMTMYGANPGFDANQIMVLFIPVMVPFGLAFLFVLLARLRSSELSESLLIGLGFAVVFIITAAPMLLELPREIKTGFALKARGLPNWPPYYPTGLNTLLPKVVAENDVVVTDQPWAVSWYTDRPALWIPRTVDNFSLIKKKIEAKNLKISGFLVTPSSHGNGSMLQVSQTYGDFAPMVLEGAVITVVPQKPVFLIDLSPRMKQIKEEYAGVSNRLPILGTQMMFYSKDPIPAEVLKR